MASRSFPSSHAGQLACVHPSCATKEGHCSHTPNRGQDIAGLEVDRCRMMHMLKQNKRVHNEHETGRDIPIQGDKPIKGFVGFLSLVRKYSRASLISQMVKSLLAMQERWAWFLGWEDPQEKGMAIHSSILPCRIPWTEEPGGLQFMGLQRVRYNRATIFYSNCILRKCSRFKVHSYVTEQKPEDSMRLPVPVGMNIDLSPLGVCA